MPSTGAAVDVAVVSVRGPLREENEDAALVATLPEGGVVAALSDGMGGHEAGREAAETVVRVARHGLCRGREISWHEALTGVLLEAHEVVCSRARGGAQAGMGATAVLAVVEVLAARQTLYLAHVGDSRAYLLRGRSLLRLTEDHSRVAQLLRAGHLSEREAFEHPDRHVLRCAIGQGVPLQPEVHTPIPLDPGDRLLLTSDGLHGSLTDPEIEALASSTATAADIGERLIAAAFKAGGEDDVSVICLCLPEPLAVPNRPTRVTATRVRSRR